MYLLRLRIVGELGGIRYRRIPDRRRRSPHRTSQRVHVKFFQNETLPVSFRSNRRPLQQDKPSLTMPVARRSLKKITPRHQPDLRPIEHAWTSHFVLLHTSDLKFSTKTTSFGHFAAIRSDNRNFQNF